jgi:hypothetical protein
MIKRICDVISFVSIGAFLSVILWVAIWGEAPREPRHLSIQAKIILWDTAPCAFGVIWLIFRAASPLAKRFPFLFSHDGRPGLLFYLASFVVGLAFLERLLTFLFAN